jgi:hypothetical protein
MQIAKIKDIDNLRNKFNVRQVQTSDFNNLVFALFFPIKTSLSIKNLLC